MIKETTKAKISYWVIQILVAAAFTAVVIGTLKLGLWLGDLSSRKP